MNRTLGFIISGAIAVLVALLGDVVAGYLTPAFEDQRWLAILIFTIVTIAGILLTVYLDRRSSKSSDSMGASPLGVPTTQYSGEQLKQIENALLDGYDQAGLDRMVSHGLSVRLDHVAGGDNLTAIVHNLVDWAKRNGRLPELIDAACADNPQNESLKALHTASATWPVKTADTDTSGRGRSFRRLWPVLGLALLLVTVAVAGYIRQRSQTLCGGNPLCVLVAEFSSRDRQAARDLAEEIRDELVEELGPDAADGAVFRIARRVDNEAEAQALAREEDALLLVWGSIKQLDGNRLRVHFELADLLGVGESTGLGAYRAEPINYDAVRGQVECTDCFDVSIGELGQRIDVVAHAAAGFLHYAERPEEAYQEFLLALHCAGEPMDPTLMNLLDPQCEVTEQPEGWNPGLLTYYAGKSAALSGDYAVAIDLLTRAAEQNRDDPAAMIGMADAYRVWIGHAHAPEVLAALTEAEARIRSLILRVSDDDDLALLHHDLGLVHELAGDWVSAADEYGKAARLFGDQPGAYVSLVQQGHAQRQAGDLDGAEATLLHAAELVPDAPWAYLELAQLAWYGDQDQAGAAAWLEQADDAAPGAAAVQIERAELCRSWADYACAEEAYETALASRDGSGWLHMRVGDFYRPTDPVLPHQSWDSAAAQYEHARDYRGQDPWLAERLGYVAANRGKFDLAAEEYETAVALTYDESAPAKLYCGLALAYERAGRADEADQARAECDRRKASPQE